MQTLFTPTLADAFERAGIPMPGREPTRGQLVRFPTNGTTLDRAGWVRVFPDGDGAAFGDWRAGAAFSWQRRDRNAPPLSASERAAIQARATAAHLEVEREQQRQYADAASKAARIWSDCTPLESHAYLTRKGVCPHGARLDRTGRLTVPVLSPGGAVQSLQFIDHDGVKTFFHEARARDGRFYLGEPVNGVPIVIAEGFATAASIRETAAVVVVAAFSGGNLKPVAADLRRRFPLSRIVIAGDLDANDRGRAYAEAAKAACEPAALALPAFTDRRAKGDFNDLHQAEGADAVKRQIDAALVPASRFALRTTADLLSLPPMRWRIRGVLPEAGVAAVFGASGSGKSFLAIDMGMAIADGREWFGHRVNKAPVLYAALEGEAGIAGRVSAYGIARSEPSRDIRYLVGRFNLLDPAEVSDLANAIRVAGGVGGVVMLDTLNRAAPDADENDSKDMGAIIEAAKSLQREIGGLVILVHHTGKDATKGLRGHSSLLAALDCALEVTRDLDRRQWSVYKSKDGSDGDAHPFHLDVVEIGEVDGEPATSCVVRPQDGDDARGRRPLPPKAGHQRMVWDALGEPFKQSQNFGMASAPSSRPCITMEAAIAASRGRLVCDPKRQTERAQAAIRGLVDRGVLQHRDGWLWCA